MADALTFTDRCAIAAGCLPKADYRAKLEALHAEMLAAMADETDRSAKLAAWLQWCLDNCDDSPEHNFGTTAADHMRALLAGKPAPMPPTKGAA